ncbi:MAG: dihydrodipicolinate synthase family protein [Planctomycetota bacterium]|jgi:4-hydroxy-tetrahydrodipicolinate synthase
MSSKRLTPKIMAGIWSATPTPFTSSMDLDRDAIPKLIDHHIRLGVKGLFIGGTCGEGPWLPTGQFTELLTLFAEANRGRLLLSAQVTDNSTARVLDNIETAKAAGIDIAIMAAPPFLFNPTPKNIENHFLTAIQKSPLPVGFYDRGKHSSLLVPIPVLKKIYAHRKVVLIKDSSGDPARNALALAARRKRKGLSIFNGDEFDCVRYIEAGYDGLMLGGVSFNGYLAGSLRDAVLAGDITGAEKLQDRMNRMMFKVYGGRSITCWLAGQKYLMKKLGVFSTHKNHLGYELTPSCKKAIDALFKKDADVLLP